MSDDTGRPGRDAETSSGRGAGEDALAPVIPLFGAKERAGHDRGAVSGHPSLRSTVGATSAPWALPGAAVGGGADDTAAADSADEIRDRAEALLLRRLRGRSLSLVEARAVVREVEGADETGVEEVVA